MIRIGDSSAPLTRGALWSCLQGSYLVELRSVGRAKPKFWRGVSSILQNARLVVLENQ